MTTNFVYTTNIPLATNKPSVDQPNMKTNTNSINSIIGVDHLTFGTATGSESDGWHTVIHSVPQGSDPGSITGFGQVYTKTVSGDQQLFYESGNGVVSQLTPGGIPVAATNGYVFLPGGIIMQWGQVSFSGTSQQQGTVTYTSVGNIAFPNNTFNVQTTLHDSGGSNTSNTQNVSVFTFTNTSFKWNYTGSSAYDRFYWIAVGN